MFLLTQKEKSGINPLFPLFYKDTKGSVPINTIESRRNFSSISCFLNGIFIIFSVILISYISNKENEKYFLVLSLVFLSYVLSRVYFKTKITYIDNVQSEIKISNAPPIVWLEHFSFSLSIILMLRVAYQVSAIGIVKNAASFIMMFFFIYFFAPVINWIKYRSKE